MSDRSQSAGAQVAQGFAEVHVEPEMLAYMPAAATRIGYLRPDVEVRVKGGSFLVRCSGGHVPEDLRRDLLHAVYREKIHSGSSELRACLLGHLLDR